MFKVEAPAKRQAPDRYPQIGDNRMASLSKEITIDADLEYDPLQRVVNWTL
jgi:hypothetical protein